MRWGTLFSGVDGAGWGITAAGHQVVWSVENDPIAAQYHRINHPGVTLYEADVQDVDVSELENIDCYFEGLSHNKVSGRIPNASAIFLMVGKVAGLPCSIRMMVCRDRPAFADNSCSFSSLERRHSRRLGTGYKDEARGMVFPPFGFSLPLIVLSCNFALTRKVKWMYNESISKGQDGVKIMNHRRATDEQIKEMYALYQAGQSMNKIGEQYNINHATVHNYFKQRGWERRSCKGPRDPLFTSYKRPAVVPNIDDTDLVALKQAWDKLDSTAKGTITESRVKVRLAELGFDVWEPIVQNHTTDLLVLHGNRAIRVQVKTASYNLEKKNFRANLSRHRRKNARGGRGVTLYSDKEVDFFIIFCAGLPNQVFYVIPANEIGYHSTQTKFFPHREKVVEHKDGLSWERYINAFHLLNSDEEAV